MLKYLTHKLRTQSINEENNVNEKIDGHDSGTESDGDIDPKDDFNEHEMDLSVKLRPETTSPTCSTESPYLEPPHLLSYDQNSSEEELEVINGPLATHSDLVLVYNSNNNLHNYSGGVFAETSPKRCSSTILEKRKRSLAHNSDDEVRHLLEKKQQQPQISAPVNFRTSPPLEALKPHRGHIKRSTTPLVLTAETVAARLNQRGSIGSSGRGSLGDISIITPSNSGDNISALSLISTSPLSFSSTTSQTTSPISNLAAATTNFNVSATTTTNYCDNILNCNINHHIHNHPHQPQSLVIPMDVRSTSPPTKKKSRHHHPTSTQRLQRSYRPCLDFDKMQQLKARSVTTWRHSNEHGELSVFCW